jgi:hypothetical protein
MVPLLAVAAASLPPGCAPEAPSPIERYRALEFPAKVENFENGWKERVTAEFDVVNDAETASLKAALDDPDPFVRSIAARALGIRSDRASADALAARVETDAEPMVRIRAVEALGLLRMKPEVVERATKDSDAGVCWSANLAARQVESATDYAALVREAFAAGIEPDAIDSARVGQPAPDFTAYTVDGKPFQLSSVLGKKPIALYFAAFDG